MGSKERGKKGAPTISSLLRPVALEDRAVPDRLAGPERRLDQAAQLGRAGRVAPGDPAVLQNILRGKELSLKPQLSTNAFVSSDAILSGLASKGSPEPVLCFTEPNAIAALPAVGCALTGKLS